MTIHVQITASGRMCLPAALRKRLGLTGGGALLIEETDDGLVLRTPAQAVAHARALARHHTDGKAEAGVDAFLAARRGDSGE